MKTNKPRSKGGRTASSGSTSGVSDDASTTEVRSGSSPLIHGVVVDGFKRSRPTNLQAFHVRKALMEFNDGSLPWYDPESTFSTGGTSVDSVSTRLSVSVKDANDWLHSNVLSVRAASRFSNYADVPLNEEYHRRLNFFAYVPDAAELDESFQFEAQMFAVDEFSQLFSESCTFHFGFLADLDMEYHRLRAAGAVGMFNESSEYSPWYHAYHFYRDMIEDTYLTPVNGGSPLIQLPVGAINSNWRIIDVLAEIERLMAPDGSNLLPDIRLSQKGVARGHSSVALGLQTEEAYADADGNSRFYFPWMEVDGTVAQTVTTVERVPSFVSGWTQSTGAAHPADFGNAGQNPGDQGYVSHTFQTNYLPDSAGFTFDSMDSEPFDGLTNYLNLDAEYSTSMLALIEHHFGGVSVAPAVLDGAWVDLDLSLIRDLPGPSGMHTVAGTGGAADVNVAYWSGHNLNLVQLIQLARRIGRSLEPEVAEALLPSFGQVTSLDMLKTRSTGMTSRFNDTLYNLYAGKFSFNENPVRTYTAAHLGPSDIKLPQGELTLEGVPIHTAVNGETLTAREKYWTPTTLVSGANNDGATISAIMGAHLAGARMDFGLLGELDLASADARSLSRFEGINTSLLTRLLGTNSSMYTKSEKPVMLPAGKAMAEAVYASGVGVGTLQLVVELLLGSVGGEPRFGLGHSGFTDLKVVSGNLVPRITEARDASVLASREVYNDIADAISDAPGGSPVSDLLLRADLQDTGTPGQPGVLDRVTGEYAGLSQAALTPTRQVTTYLESGAYTAHPGLLYRKGSKILGNSILEESPMHHRAQWGYLAMEGPAANFDAAAVLPASSSGFNFVVTPRSVTIGNITVDLLENDADMPRIRAYGSGGLTAGTAVTGEPVIVTTSPGTTRLHLAVPMNDVGVGVVCPTATPLQYVMAAIQNIVHSGVDELPEFDANGELSISMNVEAGISTTSTTVLFSHGDEHGLYGDIDTYTDYFSSDDWNFTLVKSGEDAARLFPPIAREEWEGTFNPSIGKSFDLPISSELLDRYELMFEGVTNLDVQPGQLSDAMENVVWEAPTQGTFADLIANTLVGWQPPLEEGDVFSTQSHSFFTTSERIVTSAGAVEDLRSVMTFEPLTLQAYLNQDIWPGYRVFGSTTSGLQVMHTAPGGSDAQMGTRNGQAGGVNTSMVTDEWGRFLEQATSTGYRAGPHDHEDSNRAGSYAIFAADNERGNNAPVLTQLTPLDSMMQATLIYPDDPEHKMLYRPWRNIVDAAVAKELRYTFLNLGDSSDFSAGELGIEVIGDPKEFRFSELLRADRANVFLMEKVSTKTRMVNPDHRSIMTFTKTSTQDPTTRRHMIADATRLFNSNTEGKGLLYAASGSKLIYNRANIRDLQLGRQMNRQS